MSEKLDAFKKILLATGQVNYMSSILYDQNENLRLTIQSEEYGVFEEGVLQRQEVLDHAVKELSKIVERLADLMNAQDSVMPIDARVSKYACEILLLGMDEVETDYESESN